MPHIETLAVHAGHAPDAGTGAVSPPIHLSTTFARLPDGSLPQGFLYARSDNPTRHALEDALAPLEGGAVALAFASGMAATTAVVQALAAGDHVIAPTDAYYGTAKVLREMFARWGLASTFVDLTDPAAVERAVTPEDPADLDRDPVQPHPGRHRHRAGGRHRPRSGRLVRLRQHLGHPAAAATARARRPRRDARDHQVPRGPQRRDRRRPGARARPASWPTGFG